MIKKGIYYGVRKYEVLMIYFTSDLHLGHKNIIKLCDRPFASLEEMDETLIANWNQVVTNGDTIYIVGDLMFRTQAHPADVLNER